MHHPFRTRVLRVIPSYFPYMTGPAKQARAISIGLAREGIDSSIITTNLCATWAPEREKLDGVPVARLPIQTGVLQYHIARGAWRELIQQPADLIHIHSYRSYLADAAALAARKRGIPFILHFHGSLAGYRHIVPTRSQWPYHAYDWLTSLLPTRNADQFIVSTRSEKEEAVNSGVDASRISVIPMGIDIEEFDYRDVTTDTTHILFVGRITVDRNVASLLRALYEIRRADWRCTIVGGDEQRSALNSKGHLSELQQLVKDLGLASRVTFVGPLGGEDLRRIYANAGIFVYPSRYENFGQSVLEAAAAGCALVTTPVGVANDLIEDGVSGFVVAHNQIQELAARISWLLKNPAQQRILGDNARGAAARGYAWSEILQRYAAVYSRVLRSTLPAVK